MNDRVDRGSWWAKNREAASNAFLLFDGRLLES